MWLQASAAYWYACTTSRVNMKDWTNNAAEKKTHIQLICSALLIGALDCFRTTVNIHKMQAGRHAHSLTRQPASLGAHSPSRAPRTRRENFSCLIAWVQVGAGRWIAMTVTDCSAFSSPCESEQHATAEHTPTPEGVRATFQGKTRFTLPFQLRLSVCVCELPGTACWLIHAI